VLAMANHPSYNPNKRTGQKPAARRNRAATDLFEPGSTIKPLTVAAALQNDLVTPDTIIDTSPGYIRVDGKTIRDHRDYGRLQVSDVLTKSSNVGVTRLALRMGEHRLPRFFSRFGLGEETQLRFPGESQGVLPWRTQWRDIEQATLSYGYGLSMTVLQLARAYAVFANEGKRVPLTLRKRPTRPEGQQVLDPGVARQVLTMLRSVVSREGTARRAQVAGYEVAGKTGTVHKVTSNGYADDRYIAVFAGMAPAADPRYVTAVVVDDPRGEDYYGGLVAAPAFSRIMAGVLRTREVAPREPAGTWAGGDDQGGRT
jgi:cell division protein FtsI (penicillin-binding protein 3)